MDFGFIASTLNDLYEKYTVYHPLNILQDTLQPIHSICIFLRRRLSYILVHVLFKDFGFIAITWRITQFLPFSMR